MPAGQDTDTQGSTPQTSSPIQPGQFVVVEGKDGVFKQPPVPSIQSTPPRTAGPPPDLNPLPSEPAVPPAPSAPGPQVNPFSSHLDPSAQSETAASIPSVGAVNPPISQPDPTPYAPPAQEAGPPQGPSVIKKLRIVMIIAGVLILAAGIAAFVWFFVLNKKPGPATKTEVSEEAQIEEPPQIEKRKSGGFSELPPATQEAAESTPSGGPGQ